MELLRENWPLILVAVVLLAILAFVLLRPRQRVQLTDSTPTRPHMAYSADSPREGNDVASEVAAAASDVAGEVLDAPVHSHLVNGPEAGGEADDLQRMKGVGPKFAQMLNARGITRYEQIARLSADDVQRLDAELGPFRGRLQRDRIVDQADYLSRGDQDGFEQTFGKL